MPGVSRKGKVVSKGDWYILSDSIWSKRAWCLRKGGVWIPSDRVWVFKSEVAPSAQELEKKYHEAEYDKGTRAREAVDRKKVGERIQHLREAAQQRLDKWRKDLQPTPTVERHEEGTGLGGRFIGYRTGPSLASVMEKFDPTMLSVETLEYDEGAVLIYDGNYD